MSILAACLFSLVWAAAVWALAASTGGDRFRTVWSPGLLLAVIAASVLPCVVFVIGWQWPFERTISASGPIGMAGEEFRAISGIADRTVLVSGGSALQLESIVVALYLSGVAWTAVRQVYGTVRVLLVLRSAQALGHTPGGWPLRATDRPVPPFAVGGPMASVVMPEGMLKALSKGQMAAIVAHEESHLRHRDPLVSQCLTVLGIVFWFNPFVKDLIGRWRSAVELRADSDALKHAGSIERRAYAQVLIGALRGGVNPLPVSFSSRNIRNDKMRISAIVKGFEFDRAGRARLFACCAALMLLAAGTAGALSANTGAATTLEEFISGGRVVSAYGVKRKNLRVHTGVDVAARLGTEILAPNDALVTQATDLFRGNPRWGKAVVLEFEDDVVVWLTHLDSYTVSPGDRVAAGQVIGTVGSTGQSTGSHVHVETYKDARRVDPVTIWPFLQQAAK
ncbi:M23/M56 family metallopeptidase [Hoeflea prorocentri]|uniref:M23/M56 family metallopeptidase n=1 Tax=Hoeflea prorocentri TaxID=1922333 RepID=A0A9X3UQ42_9HYPH|nr:M23/M56 family metallopeptidase [Hoeflea prorocentri]MCY6383314.1 M23/M56 family metallopeptidase [Hoeflea prorocentri]MDA5401114.1 M23/M56 family metallopeptidase [Hoeflea prorocentri]